MEPQKIELWKNFLEVCDILRQRSEGAAATESRVKRYRSLTVNQVRMMLAVLKLGEKNPDGVSLKMIAQRINISAAAASEMVEVLVRKDVLARKQSQQDRRAICVELSAAMQQDVDEVYLLHQQTFDQLCRNFTEPERTQFEYLIDKLLLAGQNGDADSKA